MKAKRTRNGWIVKQYWRNVPVKVIAASWGISVTRVYAILAKAMG